MAKKEQQRDVQVAIIGAGIAGIALAIELRKQLGLESFTIYERAEREGGTWRDNTYPGCACDIPSHWYSLSTELNSEWSHYYSPQPEIQAYWERIFSKHELGSKTQFGYTFKRATWDAERQGYDLLFETRDGEEHRTQCDVLVSAIGGFSTPLDRPPDIPGLDSFAGVTFHSARYKHEVELAGKRVGVIGNGCTGAQLVPSLANAPESERPSQIINFCRTPSWFVPREQKAYSGTAKALFRSVPGLMRAYRWWIAATNDARFVVWRLSNSTLRHYVEEESTKYITQTAPSKYHTWLIPHYPFGCKRVVIDPGYLASLHHDHVSLVTDRIVQVEREGIRGASGELYELDVIILATGFDLSATGDALNIFGRDGLSITDRWQAVGGAQAYRGTAMAHFPNFYALLGPNTATGHGSVIHAHESQAQLITQLVAPLARNNVRSLEVKLDAEERYNSALREKLKDTVWAGGCASYYKQGDKIVATFPGSLTELYLRLRRPKWEDWTQIGGSPRLAVAHRRRQLRNAMLLLVTLLLARSRTRGKLLSALFMAWRRIALAVQR